jgi:hypothetical protein
VLETLSIDELDERYLYNGCDAPPIVTIKGFVRWKVRLAHGDIVQETTVDSVCTFMELGVLTKVWMWNGKGRALFKKTPE